MTRATAKRPPLSQECIEARIVLRVAQLRELAAWTACEYWRQRKGADRFSMRGLRAAAAASGTRRRRPQLAQTAPGICPPRADRRTSRGRLIPVSERARLPVARHVDLATAL